jgi:hypothetical protein
LDAAQISAERAAAAVARLIAEHEIQVLNVAGPRLSGWAEGYAFAVGVVGEVIERQRQRLDSNFVRGHGYSEL